MPPVLIQRIYPYPEDVSSLGIEIIGVVERDDQIISAANCGEPVVYNQKSKAGQAFTRIAARVCGEQVPVPSFDSGSFWSRISRKLGVNA